MLAIESKGLENSIEHEANWEFSKRNFDETTTINEEIILQIFIRLEYDMSWTPMDKRKKRDAEEVVVTKILKAHQLIGPAHAANHAKEIANSSVDSNFKPLMALLDKVDSDF